MKIILVGHEGNKHILPASSYLVDKYIPKDFDVEFLNYGEYDHELLVRGRYVMLADEQIGGASSWSKYIKSYLETLEDEYVIFSLDDFFLCRNMDMNVYDVLLSKMENDKDIVCAKLGLSPSYRPHEYEIIDALSNIEIFKLLGDAPYSASTQYAIWNRKVLVEILSGVTDAWKFEMDGSLILNKMDKQIIGSTTTCLSYCESSAVSNRHPNKVSVLGVKTNVVEDMIANKLLDEDTLILGQPIGEVNDYSSYKNDLVAGVDTIDDEEYRNYCKYILDEVTN